MRTATATSDYAAWRDEARSLLAGNIPPADVLWTVAGATGGLFADGSGPTQSTTARVPKRFLDVAQVAVLHRDPTTHDLLYRVLWRLTHGERALLDDAADPDVRALQLRVKQVRRDEHDMHAFLRFRQVGDEHVAWYAPQHLIVERVAPFFRDRFQGMRWAILTPDRSVAWDLHELTFGPGAPRHAAPAADELEDLWRTYYAAIFNPARANPKVMRQHMPQRLWAQLPESSSIPTLLAASAPRVDAMLEGAAPHEPLAPAILPVRGTPLPVLREQAARCTACELCGPATQTVFGEGPPDARLVLVGEQPGDEEDLRGHPFVGPSGKVLDDALQAAGIDRGATYVTNAVKHFRFLPRGKMRLHQRPTADQVRACKPWLGAELAAIRPHVIVCLGATAAQSLIGSRFRVTQQRGEVLRTHWSEHLLATHHPAAILRADDGAAYMAELIADLRSARALLS